MAKKRELILTLASGTIGLATGAAAGAAFMFFADPDRGRRRRRVVRDRFLSYLRRGSQAAIIVSSDVAHRAYGTAIEMLHRFDGHARVDDDVLVERVRARLGHVLRHPIRVEVRACDGEVVLQGDVRADEARPLFHEIKRVPGVRRVIDRTFHYTSKAPPDRRARGTHPHAEHQLDPERAEQALGLGDIDSDPGTTQAMLDELGIRFSTADDD